MIDVEHLFLCVLTIHVSSWEKCLFKRFVHFQNWVLLLNHSSLYILDINPSSDIWFANVFFFPFVSHLFTLWIVSFDTQKLGARVCYRVLMLSHFSCVWLCATLWTAACQVPLSMRFSRQEYWSKLSCSPPGDRPDPGITPAASLTSPVLAGGFFTTRATGKPREGMTESELKGWLTYRLSELVDQLNYGCLKQQNN